MAKVNRSTRLERRRTDALETKLVNREAKTKERARRDGRMVEKLQSGSLPYTPDVMSWASRRLAKKAGRITQDDVTKLIGQLSPAAG